MLKMEKDVFNNLNIEYYTVQLNTILERKPKSQLQAQLFLKRPHFWNSTPISIFGIVFQFLELYFNFWNASPIVGILFEFLEFYSNFGSCISNFFKNQLNFFCC